MKKKDQNDEAGEDDPDVDDESLENRSVLLPALAFAGSAMNKEYFSCPFVLMGLYRVFRRNCHKCGSLDTYLYFTTIFHLLICLNLWYYNSFELIFDYNPALLLIFLSLYSKAPPPRLNAGPGPEVLAGLLDLLAPPPCCQHTGSQCPSAHPVRWEGSFSALTDTLTRTNIPEETDRDFSMVKGLLALKPMATIKYLK